jgi:hypothetical protein
MPANCKIDEFELQNINQAYALSFKKEVGFRINYLHILRDVQLSFRQESPTGRC